MEDQSNCEDTIQWERVIKRLIRFAHIYACKKAGLKESATADKVIISIGIGPSDLMCKVIADFIDDKIHPNPAKLFTEAYLMNLLQKAYREELKDFFKSPRVKTIKYAEEIAQFSKDGEKIEDSFFSAYNVEKLRGVNEHEILSDTASPLDEELMYRAQLTALYNVAKDDPKVQQMINAICEHDLETPREIASFLKTSVQDIYNRKKKMKRMYEGVMQSYRERKKAV